MARFAAALAAGLAMALLAACGGGSDAPSQADDTGAMNADAAAPGAARAMTAAPRQRVLSRARAGVTAVAASPGGGAFAVAAADGSVRLLDGAGQQQVRLLAPAGGPPAAGLIFGPGGSDLYSVGRDSVVKVWDTASGKRRLSLRGSEQALRAVAASGDGAMVATGGEDARVLLWDGRSGRLKAALQGQTDFVNALALSANGRWLASAGADGRVRLWNTAAAQPQSTLNGHRGEVNAVAFSRDGRLLASAGEDGQVLLWAVAGPPVRALEQAQSLAPPATPSTSATKTASTTPSTTASTTPPTLPGSAVRSLAFSADGTLLAAGAASGQVTVWDMASRRVVQQFAASASAINALTFDGGPHGLLLAGSEEGQVTTRSVASANGAAR